MAFTGSKWREIFRQLTPGFLHRRDGGLVLFSLMYIQDAFLERAYQGLNARFPRALDADAHAFQSQDRGITRGRVESLEHFAERLRKWRRERKKQGSPWALLRQVQEYFREADLTGWECYTIDASGAKWEIAADGTESVSYSNAWNWDGEAVTASNFARWWLVIIPSAGAVTANPDWGDPDLYGGALYSDAHAVGHEGISARDAKAIRDIVSDWGAVGVLSVQAIISLDGSDPVPDGSWNQFTIFAGAPPNANRIPRTDRDSFRFWFLSDAERFYAGDPSVEYFGGASTPYGGRVYTPGAGLYTPDGTTWDASDIPLPGGGTYTPDGSVWPEDPIPLIDDGDVPV